MKRNNKDIDGSKDSKGGKRSKNSIDDNDEKITNEYIENSDDDNDTNTQGNNNEKRKIIVILDKASLETTKTKKGEFQLLNCDDHLSIMRKHSKNPEDYRPDIIHQELMAVLDSPLNKAGLLKVYVHTDKNVLIEINPATRIPRTFKRFSGLMVQLLHKLKIRSADGKDVLLKVIKNPISRHLPAGAVCYGFSQKGVLHKPSHFANKLPDNGPIVLVLGAMATGSINNVDHPYMQELISISQYPLSGVVAINRVLGAIENYLGIL
jgi:rRNA small subunit pseudouridine methyltransferase Nep1